MKDSADRLTMITAQMEKLAAELRRLEAEPATREEIINQIVRLGRLYLAIRAGTDLFMQDR